MEVDHIERTYSHYAGVYDLIFDHILQPGRRRAVRVLDPQPGERVLEIGIGTGLSIPYYPDHSRITGIDISASMLQEAAKKLAIDDSGCDVELLQMDAAELEFGAGAFDRVLASYVLSTVPEPDKVLDGIVRVCRPGGRVVIVNHFRSALPPVALAEHALRPLTWKLGFRMELPVETVLRHPHLQVQEIRRTNLLGLWKLIVAHVQK